MTLCPKCGTENPNDNKFCGKCGKDISPVTKSKKINGSKRNKYLISYAIVILVIVSIGLIASNYLPSLFPSSLFPFGKPSVHVDDIKGTIKFTSTQISFRIYNSGDAIARNVAVTISVSTDGIPNDVQTKHLYIGNIEPGESKQITTEVESTNIKNKSFQIIPSYDGSSRSPFAGLP